MCKIIWEEARNDVITYLSAQQEDYFTERGRTKEDVLSDAEVVNEIAAEHMRCVNRYGNEREWSVENACDVEPGFGENICSF